MRNVLVQYNSAPKTYVLGALRIVQQTLSLLCSISGGAST